MNAALARAISTEGAADVSRPDNLKRTYALVGMCLPGVLARTSERGYWLIHDRMPILSSPVPTLSLGVAFRPRSVFDGPRARKRPPEVEIEGKKKRQSSWRRLGGLNWMGPQKIGQEGGGA